MQTPLVTIAIPAYKSSFLRQAIESALAQTYTNIELIIVDDQSPNNIQEIVKSFDDTRIKYYRNKNNLGGKNPALNWNQCLHYAQGEYFSLLCDDDLYEPTFIEEMLQLAKKYPQTNVFRTRANIIDKNGKAIDWYPSAPEWEDVDDYIWHVNRRGRKQTISEFMYKTAHIRKMGGYFMLPLAWYADYVSVYRFALEGGIASCYKILMHFRLSGQNISSMDDQNSMTKLEAIKQYLNWITQFIQQNSLYKAQCTMGDLHHSIMLDQEYILEKAASKTVLLQAFRHKKSLKLHTRTIKKAIKKRLHL